MRCLALIFAAIAYFATEAHAATRLYFTTTAAPVSYANAGTWDDTSGSVQLYCQTSPSGGITTATNTESVTTNSWDMLVLSCVTQSLSSNQTISGTARWLIGAEEDNALMNTAWHVHARVIDFDGNTRGTLLNDYIETEGANEWPTTPQGWANVDYSSGQAISTVNAIAGDRIVIELGARLYDNGGAEYYTRLWYGSGGVDMVNVGDDETTKTGWFEFSSTHTFGFVASPTPTVTPTPTQTPTGPSATPTPSITATPTDTVPAATPTCAANLVINTTADTHDANPLDGYCSDIECGAEGLCSIRAAAEIANANSGRHCVSVPAGTYTLNQTDASTYGDIEVSGYVHYTGAGSAREDTIISLTGSVPRAFEVEPGGNLTLEKLTVVAGGRTVSATAREGGCLYIAENGYAHTINTWFDHCDNKREQSDLFAGNGGFGGAVFNAGVFESSLGSLFDTGVSNYGACLFNASTGFFQLTDTEMDGCHTLGLDQDSDGTGDTAGGGAGVANMGRGVLNRWTCDYCRARLGCGGGGLLQGDCARVGTTELYPYPLEVAANNETICINCSFIENRCRRCGYGAIGLYDGTLNAKLTTVTRTQSYLNSGVGVLDGAVLNASWMGIEGHNISDPGPPDAYYICYKGERPGEIYGSGTVNVLQTSMDDGLDQTPAANVCAGFEHEESLCLKFESNYGGYIETVKLGTSVVCTSPMIDGSGVTDCDEVVDARGFTRPFGDCDIGAFELQSGE